MSYRITHVRLSSGGTTVEHITDVKGVSDSGSAFTETVAQVVGYLKRGMSYYVSVGGNTIAVTHSTSGSGREYIKTKPDATTKDNLLSLPRF
jgi:hypothetical protein